VDAGLQQGADQQLAANVQDRTAAHVGREGGRPSCSRLRADGSGQGDETSSGGKKKINKKKKIKKVKDIYISIIYII